MLATRRRDISVDRPFFPKLSRSQDLDDLPRQLSALARVYTSISHLKNVFRPKHRRPETCHHERSPKRRRVLDSLDMPREGKASPTRRSVSDKQSASGQSSSKSSTVTVVAQNQSPASSRRDGEGGRSHTSQASRKSASSTPAQSPSPRASGSPSPHSGPSSSASRFLQSQETNAYIQARIYQRRAELIKRLMALIQPCLDKHLDALERAACDAEGGSPPRAATTTANPRPRVERGTKPVAGQKRQSQRGSRDSDDDEEGGERNPSKSKKRTKTVTENHQKFACPYYKRFPEKFRNQRTCSGPGWDEVHRMKEHLDRRHRLPKYKCKRCCEYFEKESALEDHQRMDRPCAVKDRHVLDPVNGFDEKQAELMRKKGKKSEVERWQEIYTILFGVAEGSPDMPSPYYDAAEDARTASKFPIPYEKLKPFTTFCRDAGPKAIQQALENELDREAIALEQRMVHRLTTVVQDAIMKLFSTYQAIESPDDLANMPDPNKSRAATPVAEANAPPPVSVPLLPTEFFEFDFDLFASLGDPSFTGAGMASSQTENHCDHQSFDADSGFFTQSYGDHSTQYSAGFPGDARHF